MDRLADLAESNLWTLYHGSNIFNPQPSAGLRLQNGLLDVLDVFVKADFTNINLLLTLLDEAAAGVRVICGELLFDLADAESIGDEFVRVDSYLVLARDATEARDIDNARYGFELLFDRPVLKGFEVHVVVERVAAAHRVPKDLADRTPVAPDLRLHPTGTTDRRETFHNPFAAPVIH